MKEQLSSVARVVGPHGMVLLDTDEGYIETSNHEQWARVNSPMPNKGRLIVDFARLLSFVSKAGEIDDIQPNGSRATFKSNGSRITLPLYQELPWERRKQSGDMIKTSVDPEILDTLSPVLAPADDPRPATTGIFLGRDGFVATDTKLLIWAHSESQVESALLPRHFAQLIRSEGEVYCSENFARATTEAGIFETSLINANFFDFKRAVPDPKQSFSVDSQELRSALLLAESVSKSATINVSDGSAKLTAISGPHEIVVDMKAEGDTYEFEVDCRYLRLATSFCQDTTTIRFERETWGALRVDCGIYTSALIPLRSRH